MKLLLQALFRRHHTPEVALDRPFCFETDRFAFANEMVSNCVEGDVRPQSEHETASEKRYTRHCFVVARAALQFRKFARFDATTPALRREELAKRIRQLCRRPVWMPALAPVERICFPGFANLHEISAAFVGTFRDYMGAAWPVYFRPGNMPIIIPVPTRNRKRLNGQLLRDLEKNYPTVVWLYNFPSLDINHTVLVYKATTAGSLIRYEVYDPNCADAPRQLEFDPETETFRFEPTFYFKGGAVTPRAVYRGFFE